jgi:hypothetical protein
VFAIAGPLCLITIIISYVSNSPVIAYIGLFILAVGSLIMNLAPVVIRKEPGTIAFDERDRMIERKTCLIGYCILWCFFIIMCMTVNRVIGPIILVAALVLIKLVESIATLVQYNWDAKGETL